MIIPFIIKYRLFLMSPMGHGNVRSEILFNYSNLNDANQSNWVLVCYHVISTLNTIWIKTKENEC